MPRLLCKPFYYDRYADEYLAFASRIARVPLRQAVISPSALSLLYPAEAIQGYSRDEFLADLLNEHVIEVRRCFASRAACVQIDFTEGRLAMKVDPSGSLLSRFVELNNLALMRFSPAERLKLGVHTCPGGDWDSTHSADVDYVELLPSFFALNVTNFYVALAGDADRDYVLKLMRDRLGPHQRVFVVVIAPIDPRIETPEEVRDRAIQAALYNSIEQLGTTDDWGFCPFCNVKSISRGTALAKIRARVEGTVLAARALGSSNGR